MLSLLSMAGRNLFRNKRRSIITVLGISLGLALCQTIYNLNIGNYNFPTFRDDRIYEIPT